MKRKLSIIWSMIFMMTFLLSQDYLYVIWENTPSILGFPIWVFWFGVVHLVFIGFFYFFAKKYWKE